MVAKKPSTESMVPNSEEFSFLVSMLSDYSDAVHRLEQMENDINQEVLKVVQGKRGEFASLQQLHLATDETVRNLVSAHPEWFKVQRTLKTPFGSVSLRRTSKLECANEEATIILIENYAEKNKDFDASLYIHEHKEIDKEALEKLDDDILAKFRIRRSNEDAIIIKPVKVDSSKIAKEVIKEEEAQKV